MNDHATQPILIVGAGPVGQLSALLLSHHGIPSLLVDKRLNTLSAPKAHAVNPRTLEICESIGISADRLRALGATANDGGDVRFVGQLTGPDFGSLPYERQDEDAFKDTPFPLSNIPQPVFEEELVTAINTNQDIEFRRGVECIDLVDSGDEVRVQLRDTTTGEIASESFSYVIATDGAGSSVRGLLGIEMEGPEALQDFLMIHFTADLRSYTEGRRGVLYFMFDPKVRGTLIAYDQAKTWVLMHPWKPDAESRDDYTDDRCRMLINEAVGQEVSDVVVENVSPWQMTAQIANQYRRGRVFLAGDSAHRFPPAGGLGLNTGAGDAQNITWKLAAVLRGEADDSLLDSYEVERQPVARTNSEQSLTNAAKIFDLYIALHGTDPEKVTERYAAVSENPSAFPELATAVAAQKPHFDSFNLQLGYRYNSHAVFNPAPIPEIGDVSDYRPSWEAGAHFPHQWIDVDGQRKPLQSVLPANRFSLLCGPDAESGSAENITVVKFGRDFQLSESWESVTGLPETGALLIRPDGHIAASFSAPADGELCDVMQTILGRRA